MCFVVCFYYNAQLSCGFVISIFSWIFCCCCSLLLPPSACLSHCLYVKSCRLCLSVSLSLSSTVPPTPSILFVHLSVPVCRSSFAMPPSLLLLLLLLVAVLSRSSLIALPTLPATPPPLLCRVPLVQLISSSFWVYALCSVSFSYCLIYFVGFYCGRRRVAFCVCVCLCVHVVCACVCTNSSYRVVLLLLHWRRRRGCRRRSSLVYRFVPLPSPSLHTASHYHRRHHHHRHYHCPSFVSLP